MNPSTCSLTSSVPKVSITCHLLPWRELVIIIDIRQEPVTTHNTQHSRFPPITALTLCLEIPLEMSAGRPNATLSIQVDLLNVEPLKEVKAQAMRQSSVQNPVVLRFRSGSRRINPHYASLFQVCGLRSYSVLAFLRSPYVPSCSLLLLPGHS